ncbi:MAG: OmpA family protein [Phycisphaeraceae bacterium]|nr:OmpA family protein [Phycisphaeraceae bacterium]
MKSKLTVLLAMAMFVGMSGCVAQKEADDIRALYRKSQGQVLDLQAQLEERDAQIAALRAAGSSSEELARITAERDKLAAMLAEAERQLRELGTTLPPQLSDALAELAAANPDLMTYDKARGMIQLHSDLTFALGSTTVRPEAAATLNRLAGVLNSADAQPFDIRLVGHTDNVPVTNPANKQKYEDNWGLSAGRAIAVMRVLLRSNIAPQRMTVAGRGEFDPVAANGPKGSQENRRVEIFLVASSRSPQVPAAAAPAPMAQPAPAPETPAGPAPEPAMYK